MTFDQVARLAGVSRPSMYRRWASKDQLVQEVVRAALPPPAPPLQPTGDIRQDLTAFIAGALTITPALGLAPGAMNLLIRPDLAPYLAVIQTELLAHADQILVGLLESAMRAGQVRADISPKQVGALIGGYVLWTLQHRPLPPSPDSPSPSLTGPDLTGPDLTGPDLTGPGLAGPDSAPPRSAGAGLNGTDLAGPSLGGSGLALDRAVADVVEMLLSGIAAPS